MVEITAALVKQLRDQTGQAMMDCKQALTQSGGDLEKAVDLLRKKGLAVLEKRGGKETREGRIVGKISPDGKHAALATLSSETDFTAKNEKFHHAAQALIDALLAATHQPPSTEALAQLKTNNGKVLADIINDLISQTGEKITLGEFARYDLDNPGLLFCYVHFNNKIGTLLQLDIPSAAAVADATVKTLANDLAMHITAINPLAISRSEVPSDIIARERDIAADQVKNKPQNIMDKIVDGKLLKWYQQHVLLEQPFVKDDSKTVQQLLEEIGKKFDATINIKRFIRIQIG